MTRTPLTSSALSKRLSTLAAATSALTVSSSLVRALFSAMTASARAARSATLLALRAAAVARRTISLALARISRFLPVTASMRRMPAATDDSLMILKQPIWAVFLTWVPPQNSVDQPQTSTTRTTSPYFSPKRAMAPIFLASSRAIDWTLTSSASKILSLTICSTLASFLGGDGAEVGEVEVGDVGVLIGAGLMDMVAQHLAQGCLQQVGGGVVAGDGPAVFLVHLGGQGVAPPGHSRFPARRCGQSSPWGSF